MTAVTPSPRRYAALGDSYTIGTAIDPAESWPAQLVAALETAVGAPPLRLAANLAVDGYTSHDVIRHELSEMERLRPDFVSVLIGVNDVVQGVRDAVYGANLEAIFDALLERLPAGGILTVSIPDYTLTPRGADYGDPRQQRRGIEAFNVIMAGQSAELGIAHVDIFDLSQRAADDPTLVAPDGLHPSGAQYRLWVERIAPVVTDLLAATRSEVSGRRP